MRWTDHRAQLMLFPIFRVWGTSNFSKSLSEIHWLECDRKEDQVQFCLGPNFSILWPPPTNQTNQIRAFKDDFSNPEDVVNVMTFFGATHAPQRAHYSLWTIKQITVSKNSKIFPCESFTHGIAGHASSEFASLTLWKLWVLHFSPDLCISSGGKVG